MSMDMAEKNNGNANGGDMQSGADKQKFYDFVRIQAIEDNLISRADEKTILGKGITDFGLDFQDAHGIFLSVASERNIVLASHAEQHIETFLEQMVRRGKISKSHFKDAVAIYKRLTKGRVPDAEIKKRVKELMVENKWNPRRSYVLPHPGSARWFNKI